MNTAVIEVGKTYPPKAGKKKATIKTMDGQLFGVWPNMLPGFQPGGAYEIEYESDDYQGKTYHTIKKFKVADKQHGSATNAAQAASTDEMAFIAKLIGAGIASQQIDFNGEAIMQAAHRVRAIYRELLRQSQ